MTEQKNVKIIAFVGLAGSGKSTAVKYIAELKHPKVTTNTDEEMIHEVSALVNAGQHVIAVDEILSLAGFRQLKHSFPGDVVLVSLIAHRNAREKRLAENDSELSREDWEDVEIGDTAALIALADNTIQNDGTLTDFYQQINQLLVANN